MEDRQRARAPPAVYQAIEELRREKTLFTRPDSRPRTDYQWVNERHNPGWGDRQKIEASGSREITAEHPPSARPPPRGTPSEATQQSLAGPVQCRKCLEEKGKIKICQSEDARKRHNRRVHGPRLHACSVCGQEFQQPGDVTRHKGSVHSDPSQPDTAVCPVRGCPKSYNHHQGNLDRHVEKKHPEKWLAIKATRRSIASGSTSGTAAASSVVLTPSASSVAAGTSPDFPGPSRSPFSNGNYQVEYPPLPTSSLKGKGRQ